MTWDRFWDISKRSIKLPHPWSSSAEVMREAPSAEKWRWLTGSWFSLKTLPTRIERITLSTSFISTTLVGGCCCFKAEAAGAGTAASTFCSSSLFAVVAAVVVAPQWHAAGTCSVTLSRLAVA